MKEKLTGIELENAIENRLIARNMALDAASKGDGICGALFALEASHPLAALLSDLSNYSDDDEDDVRPY
jgi:hypothetical protein